MALLREAPFADRAGSMKPAAVPRTGNAVLERFLDEELKRIWYLIQTGDMQLAQLEPLDRVPDRIIDGMIAYFAAGVVGAGEGFYGREVGAWVKL